jgi:hypothetical protein
MAEEAAARAVRLYTAIRQAALEVMREELGNGPIPAAVLLLGASAVATTTIDVISEQLGPRLTREAALGLLTRYLVQDVFKETPPQTTDENPVEVGDG